MGISTLLALLNKFGSRETEDLRLTAANVLPPLAPSLRA